LGYGVAEEEELRVWFGIRRGGGGGEGMRMRLRRGMGHVGLPGTGGCEIDL
jgi:hypothetical protein